MRPPDSLWRATLGREHAARPRLDRDVDVDIAIVGAGFSGLWTARRLLERDPSIRVAILDAEQVGFGASGRNGGWASAFYPQSFATVARQHGDAASSALGAVLRSGVEGLGADARSEGIECDYVQGGTLTLARTPLQLERLRAEVPSSQDPDLVLLDAREAAERCGARGVLGATYSPHCAAIHPLKLVCGLADAVARRGAAIYEHSAALVIEAANGTQRARVRTATGSVRADVVVRATEAYTATLPRQRRQVAPIYSLMIATEPLDDETWQRIGLHARETLTDGRHLIIYLQRTADGRLAFGGRGAPYHFASSVRSRFDHEDGVFAELERTLGELFGPTGAITHRWGGPLAMPRDGSPYVQVDRERGLAALGGYTGDGVVLSRVAAYALADAILEEQSEYASLCFVGHRARKWEPEPFRWAGINVGLWAAARADRREDATGRPSIEGKVLERLLGH